MNKNSQEKIDQRMNQILTTSMDLFFEKTYSQVSVQDICQACHITKPTFYKYLDSKESIMVHYFEEAAEEIDNSLQRMDREGTSLEKIGLALCTTLERGEFAGPDILSRYLIYCLKEKSCQRNFITRIKPLIIKEIEKAQEEGAIQNQANPCDLYTALQNMALGYSFRWCACQGSFSLCESYRESMTALLDCSFLPEEKQIF